MEDITVWLADECVWLRHRAMPEKPMPITFEEWNGLVERIGQRTPTLGDTEGSEREAGE